MMRQQNIHNDFDLPIKAGGFLFNTLVFLFSREGKLVPCRLTSEKHHLERSLQMIYFTQLIDWKEFCLLMQHVFFLRGISLLRHLQNRNNIYGSIPFVLIRLTLNDRSFAFDVNQKYDVIVTYKVSIQRLSCPVSYENPWRWKSKDWRIKSITHVYFEVRHLIVT